MYINIWNLDTRIDSRFRLYWSTNQLLNEKSNNYITDTIEKIVRLISNSNYIYFNVKADSTEFCHTILRNIAFISAACRRRRFHHPSPFIPTRFLGVARQPKIRRLLLSSSSSSSTIRYVRSFIIYARTYDVVKRDHLQLVPKGTHLAPSRTAT